MADNETISKWMAEGRRTAKRYNPDYTADLRYDVTSNPRNKVPNPRLDIRNIPKAQYATHTVDRSRKK